MILTMHITTNVDGSIKLQKHWLGHEELTTLHYQIYNLFLREYIDYWIRHNFFYFTSLHYRC